ESHVTQIQRIDEGEEHHGGDARREEAWPSDCAPALYAGAGRMIKLFGTGYLLHLSLLRDGRVVRLRPYPRSDETGTHRADDGLMRGHLSIVSLQHGLADRFELTAIEPDVVGEVRRTQQG